MPNTALTLTSQSGASRASVRSAPAWLAAEDNGTLLQAQAYSNNPRQGLFAGNQEIDEDAHH